MELSTFVAQEVVARGDVNTRFHICSNKCLRELGTARWRAERDGTMEFNGHHPASSAPVVSSGKREVSDAGRAAMRQNGLKMQHSKGNHAENPNEECELCIAEYEHAE
jgi:hypothetical protein